MFADIPSRLFGSTISATVPLSLISFIFIAKHFLFHNKTFDLYLTQYKDLYNCFRATSVAFYNGGVESLIYSWSAPWNACLCYLQPVGVGQHLQIVTDTMHALFLTGFVACFRSYCIENTNPSAITSIRTTISLVYHSDQMKIIETNK